MVLVVHTYNPGTKKAKAEGVQTEAKLSDIDTSMQKCHKDDTRWKQ